MRWVRLFKYVWRRKLFSSDQSYYCPSSTGRARTLLKYRRPDLIDTPPFLSRAHCADHLQCMRSCLLPSPACRVCPLAHLHICEHMTIRTLRVCSIVSSLSGFPGSPDPHVNIAVAVAQTHARVTMPTCIQHTCFLFPRFLHHPFCCCTCNPLSQKKLHAAI